MNALRIFRRLILCTVIACAGNGLVSAAPTPEEIAETAKWFDGLEWPDLKDKPYVEISIGDERRPDHFQVKNGRATHYFDAPKIRGFLLGEDDKSFTLFVDGTVTGVDATAIGGNRPYRSCPLVVQRIGKGWPKPPPGPALTERDFPSPNRGAVPRAAAEEPPDFSVTKRVLDLGQAIEEAQKAGNAPPDGVSQGVMFFGLARCCARAGRADLAARLDAALPTIKGPDAWGPSATKLPLRTLVEKELARAWMRKAIAELGEEDYRYPHFHSKSRPELLEEFARIAHNLPGSEEHAEAARIAGLLRQMIAEDAAHPPVDWQALEKMSREDQAKEFLFELRDQQYFSTSGADMRSLTPVESLVQLGYVAVPGLLEILDDPRPTRSVDLSRDDASLRRIVTIGDCAEDAISQIAHRDFGFQVVPKLPARDPKKAAARHAAMKAWWEKVHAEGEQATLLEAVRAGGEHASEDARHLAEVDPAAAVDAMSDGLEAAKNMWVRFGLIRQLAQIKTDAANAVLRRQARLGKDLACRLHAALELHARAAMDIVPVMVAEIRQPLPRRHYDPDLWPDDPKPLIDFLGSCGDLTAMKALVEREPQLTPDLRALIVDAALPERPPQPIPAEVEALAEKLAVSALDDRSLAFEPWPPEAGNSGGTTPEADGPRVCDIAGAALARRWADRYPLPDVSTKLERDVQYAAFRTTWRAAMGLPPLPATGRPSPPPAAPGSANVIAEIRWIDGAPVVASTVTASKTGRHADSVHDQFGIDPKRALPIKLGQPLTGTAFLAAARHLQNAFADEWLGLTVSAERLGDGRGVVIEIEPLGRRRSRVKHAMLEFSPTMDMDLYVAVTGKSVGDWNEKDFGGGQAWFQDKKHAAGIDAVLQRDAAEPIGIYFQSVAGQ